MDGRSCGSTPQPPARVIDERRKMYEFSYTGKIGRDYRSTYVSVNANSEPEAKKKVQALGLSLHELFLIKVAEL